MSAETVAAVAAVATILLALAGVLITLGRVLERQKVHGEEFTAVKARLDALEDGHGEHNAAFEALRGEIKGLNSVIKNLVTSMDRWTDRLDRHLEKD